MNTITNQHHDIDPTATAREQAESHKAQLAAKEAERQNLNGRINALTAQRDALNALPEEAAETLKRLTGQLDAQRSKFFADLHASHVQGQSVSINFNSPGAASYLLHEQLAEALPDLVRKLHGGRGVAADQRASQLSRINGEIIKLRSRLNQIGG